MGMSSPEMWLLLRGLARESGHWYDFAETFQQAVYPARVCFVDLPGAGKNRKVEVPLNMAALAVHVRERMPQHPGGWGIIGTSLGGMVALELCALLGPRARAVVVMNSSSRRSPRRHRLRLRAALSLLKIILQGELGREQEILKLTSNLDGSTQAFYADRGLRLFKERPMYRRSILRQLAAAARSKTVAPNLVQAPLLVLRSLADQLVHPECSAVLADYYNAPLRSHAWAGHDLSLDDPLWVCDQIRVWSNEL